MPQKDRPSSRRWDVVILVLVLLAGCSAGATAVLLVTRPPGNDSAEAGFTRDMMVHHAQAVQMAEIVRDRTDSDDIKLLASDIALTQQAQIGIMQGWLQAWGGLPITDTAPAMAWMGHPMDGPMPGMASPQEIDLLYKASPEQADRLFFRLMIAHHEAAIPMAEAILKRTDRPEVRQLAESIEASQRAEIQIMEGMLRNRVPDSAKVQLEPQNGSQTTGTAILMKTQGEVRIELNVSGLPEPDTTYLSHIHPGTCAEAVLEGVEEGGNHHEESHDHGGHGTSSQEIEWPLSQVQSDAQGNGTSSTTLKDASMEGLFTGDLKHLNVHAAGSGNPPILSCADLF